MTRFEKAIGANLSEAAFVARNHTASWVDVMFGSLNILLSEDCSAEDLFLAQTRWLTNISFSPWLRQTGAMFCRRLERGWLRVITHPALPSSADSECPGDQTRLHDWFAIAPKGPRDLRSSAACGERPD
jgi:hypothetical protein